MAKLELIETKLELNETKLELEAADETFDSDLSSVRQSEYI